MENPFSGKSAGRSEIILVVDDDEAVRELMAVVLEADGFTVLRAGHSQEALFRSGEFAGTIHLLLTDFCMRPHENGLELAKLVRASRPDIKVVFASGFVEQDVLREEIASTPASFLPKPFSPAGLLACVRKALGIPA
ncbi:MAG TPA: response regulator [Fibrobacteria bacterium]|nr:response regulator [Fibrobacteria bacterium]